MTSFCKNHLSFSHFIESLKILAGYVISFFLSNSFLFWLQFGPHLKITVLNYNDLFFQLAMADAQILTTTWKPKNKTLLLRQQCRNLV